jgi:hypothetical protein
VSNAPTTLVSYATVLLTASVASALEHPLPAAPELVLICPPHSPTAVPVLRLPVWELHLHAVQENVPISQRI